MRGTIGDRGYWIVNVGDEFGRRRNMPIHSLVALAFIGPRPAGLEIDHKDGNRMNNAAANLEYVTPLENIRRAFRLGKIINPSGDNARRLRFRFVQLEKMRELRNQGWTLQRIAERFRTSKGYVSEIVRGIRRAAA